MVLFFFFSLSLSPSLLSRLVATARKSSLLGVAVCDFGPPAIKPSFMITNATLLYRRPCPFLIPLYPSDRGINSFHRVDTVNSVPSVDLVLSPGRDFVDRFPLGDLRGSPTGIAYSPPQISTLEPSPSPTAFEKNVRIPPPPQCNQQRVLPLSRLPTDMISNFLLETTSSCLLSPP